MTTVAYDGYDLVADTLITGGFKHYHTKMYRIDDGTLIAGAGTVADIQRYTRWLTGSTAEFPQGDFAAIIVSTTGRVYFQDGDDCRLDITGKKFAIGSGSGFAMGAMACGKTAKEAVKIASTLDPHTGGRLETKTVKERPPGHGLTTKTG